LREIDQIKRELDVVKFETDLIKNDVEKMKDKLIDRTPEHFSHQDFIRAGIGALFLGFSALFSGNLINIAINIPEPHLYIIIFGTLLILTLEIYVVGYSRVVDKETRKFGQFWMKRITTFYLIAVFIAFILALTFGLQYLVPSTIKFLSLVIVLSAPCAIGAAFGDLIKKY
jgi:uncharacterized membrane protein